MSDFLGASFIRGASFLRVPGASFIRVSRQSVEGRKSLIRAAAGVATTAAATPTATALLLQLWSGVIRC